MKSLVVGSSHDLVIARRLGHGYYLVTLRPSTKSVTKSVRMKNYWSERMIHGATLGLVLKCDASISLRYFCFPKIVRIQTRV